MFVVPLRTSLTCVASCVQIYQIFLRTFSNFVYHDSFVVLSDGTNVLRRAPYFGMPTPCSFVIAIVVEGAVASTAYA